MPRSIINTPIMAIKALRAYPPRSLSVLALLTGGEISRSALRASPSASRARRAPIANSLRLSPARGPNLRSITSGRSSSRASSIRPTITDSQVKVFRNAAFRRCSCNSTGERLSARDSHSRRIRSSGATILCHASGGNGERACPTPLGDLPETAISSISSMYRLTVRKVEITCDLCWS